MADTSSSGIGPDSHSFIKDIVSQVKSGKKNKAEAFSQLKQILQAGKTTEVAPSSGDVALSEEERSDVTAAWTNVFKPSELVDASRTESEGEAPPQKVFCTNIYGLQYNTETKYWVPFRHGDIDLAKFTED